MNCKLCLGTGLAWLDDCPACSGTGYADGISRFDCEACGETVRESDARISPDEDGNRVVCATCCDAMMVQSA